MWFTKSRRAQNDQDYETWIVGGVSPTLNAFDNAHETRATVLIIDGRRTGDVRVTTEPVYTLEARMGTGGNNVPVIANQNEEPSMQVRRLTPIECERLMGWPDNHTATGTAGPVSDTNRYKMCGNGVASPVAEWIGQHLMAIPMLNKARPDAE
jgi:site-specific DNA-cytosine methylase